MGAGQLPSSIHAPHADASRLNWTVNGSDEAVIKRSLDADAVTKTNHLGRCAVATVSSPGLC